MHGRICPRAVSRGLCWGKSEAAKGTEQAAVAIWWFGHRYSDFYKSARTPPKTDPWLKGGRFRKTVFFGTYVARGRARRGAPIAPNYLYKTYWAQGPVLSMVLVVW